MRVISAFQTFLEKAVASRKFWAWIGSLLAIFAPAVEGKVSWEFAVAAAMVTTSVYLGAQGFADGKQ